MIGSIIYLAIVVIVIAGMWKTFEKAGQPGWGCIFPIYNIYLMTKIAAKPAWWVIMFFIPLVNIVFAIMLYNEIAKKFGQGIGFTIGLILLPFVFFPILGFGDYTGGIENVKTREYRSQFLKDLEESSEYAVCREKPIINQLQK